MASAGRKTKLTVSLIETAEKLIGAGNFDRVVIEYLGISHESWYGWLREGEKDKKLGKRNMKVEFFDRIKKAQSGAEMRAVSGILQAGRDNWTAYAWFLERKYPDRWSKRETHQITGADGGPVEFVEVKEKLLDEIRMIKENRIVEEVEGE
jgi:transposase